MEALRTSLVWYMSPVLEQTLKQIPLIYWESVQEIRLRVGMPLTFSSAYDNVPFGDTVTAQQVWDCFWRFCGQAVHTHQEELRQGFITTRDGIRVGVAGTAVLSGDTINTYRDITSLCIRVPRVVTGCANGLLPYVETDVGLCGILLCGAPACGKTTMLRDLAQTLSVRHRIAVVDERRELSLGTLTACDVLIGCPKRVGILQAVRTLAPDIVIADEIGDAAEWQAVAHSVYSGVPVIASVHASCTRELTAREEIMRMLKCGGFKYAAFLPPRTAPHAPIRIRKAAELFEDTGSDIDHACVRGGGAYGGASPDGGTASVAGLGTTAVSSAHGASLYRPSDAGDTSGIG